MNRKLHTFFAHMLPGPARRDLSRPTHTISATNSVLDLNRTFPFAAAMLAAMPADDLLGALRLQ